MSTPLVKSFKSPRWRGTYLLIFDLAVYTLNTFIIIHPRCNYAYAPFPYPLYHTEQLSSLYALTVWTLLPISIIILTLQTVSPLQTLNVAHTLEHSLPFFIPIKSLPLPSSDPHSGTITPPIPPQSTTYHTLHPILTGYRHQLRISSLESSILQTLLIVDRTVPTPQSISEYDGLVYEVRATISYASFGEDGLTLL